MNFKTGYIYKLQSEHRLRSNVPILSRFSERYKYMKEGVEDEERKKRKKAFVKRRGLLHYIKYHGRIVA
jgi:hypothetical protein